MQAEERQQRITEHLREREFCTLDELSKILKVSVSTVRRDINFLKNTGILRRTHGGARLSEQLEQGGNLPHVPNATVRSEQKECIAKYCASLVQPGQTVIMDGGSTVFSVARYLVSKHPIVITNSLSITNLYSTFRQVEVHVTGGVVYPRLGVLTGPNAVDGFSKIHADVAIMGAGGLDVSDGVTNTHALLIDMQLAMIRAAKNVIFCMDSTKLSSKSLFFLCPVDQIQTLVTNADADPRVVEALRKKGIEVHLVPN